MLTKIWKDPVWSKVIAVAIIGLIGFVFSKQATKTPKVIYVPVVQESESLPDPTIHRGVNKIFGLLLEDGGGGLVSIKEAVANCYSSINEQSKLESIKYCFAIDYSGFLFDHNISPHLTFPSDLYLTKENAIKRVSKAFDKIKMGQNRWDNFLYNLWIPETISVYRKSARTNLQ